MAKLSTNMDAYELMAYDLEVRQLGRRSRTKLKDTFFDRPEEEVVQEQIKVFRKLSETYDPTASVWSKRDKKWILSREKQGV